MAYFSFSKAILNGEPIKVFGEGKLMRDFTYIDDIVDGTIAAIDLGSPLEIFNLGNNSPYSILDLISGLESNLNKKAKIHFQPTPVGDVQVTFADIKKSQKALGFQPRISLNEGLRRFTKWYLNHVQ